VGLSQGDPQEKSSVNNGTSAPQARRPEREQYAVDLQGVSVLELEITPDVGDRQGIATLTSLRLR
jgi:hypothetical protein